MVQTTSCLLVVWLAATTAIEPPSAESCANAQAIIGSVEATNAAVAGLQRDSYALLDIKSARHSAAMELLRLHQERRSCIETAIESRSVCQAGDHDCQLAADTTEAICRVPLDQALEAQYGVVRSLRDSMIEAGREALADQREVAAAVVTLKLCRARDVSCSNAVDVAACHAAWTSPSSEGQCDIAAFDRLADIEVDDAFEVEEAASGVLGALTDTGVVDEEECSDVDQFIEVVTESVGRVQCAGQWAMQAARRLLQSATRILQPYNFIMTQCGPSVVSSLEAAAADEREAACNTQRELLSLYRNETSTGMRRVNLVGRIVMQHQRHLAAGLQARKRCVVPRPTMAEEVEVEDEVTSACGPLASISLGSIMETIENAVPDTPPSDLNGIGDTLQVAVQQFSAKLFCAVEDLKGRIPLSNAIDLLRLYNQHMNCGRDYIENYGVCRDQRAANMIDPEMTRLEAIDAGKECVAAAKATRTECRTAITPLIQQARHEIRSEMSLIHNDAVIVMRWTETQARLLASQYDSVRARLQAIADRYGRLSDIRSRIRSNLFTPDEV